MTELHAFFMRCLRTLFEECMSGSRSLQAQFDKLASDWLQREERWERKLQLLEQRIRKLEAQEDPRKK